MSRRPIDMQRSDLFKPFVSVYCVHLLIHVSVGSFVHEDKLQLNMHMNYYYYIIDPMNMQVNRH